MAGLALTGHGFGRRRWPRHLVGMPARLIVPESTYRVLIDDLSQGGARITLLEPCEFVVGVLRWMDRHAFADVAWRDGLAVGLQFDKPIPAEVLDATILYAIAQCVPARPCEVALRRC
jgi:hypothetical protein